MSPPGSENTGGQNSFGRVGPARQDGAMSSTLRRMLADALLPAMKEEDRTKVAALRIALSAVANAEAVEASGVGPGTGAYSTETERRCLSEADVISIVRGVHDELCDASDEMTRLGQERRAAEIARQATVLNGFLEG